MRRNWLSALSISLLIHAAIWAAATWKFSKQVVSTGSTGSSQSLVDVSYPASSAPKHARSTPPRKAAVPVIATDSPHEGSSHPAPPLPANSGSGGTSLISTGDPYYARVRAKIEEHLRYPASFSRRHISGKLTLAMTLAPGGELQALKLAESSGNPELDQWVLDSVRSASPFEAFQGQNRSLELPIAFVTR